MKLNTLHDVEKSEVHENWHEFKQVSLKRREMERLFIEIW